MRSEQDQIEAPDFVGLSLDAALIVAEAVGVRLEAPEQDGPPILGLSGTVVAQDPEPGVPMERGAAVVVTIEDDSGGAGVREPRRPLPPHGLASAQAESDAEL